MCYGCMARDRKYQEEIEVLKDRIEFWKYKSGSIHWKVKLKI